jgi:hypothetical protein
MGARQTSVWAQLAAAALVVLALVWFYLAIELIVQGLAHGPGSGGVLEVMVIGGGLLAILGLFHVLVAFTIWTHAPAGRNLGIVFGLIGTAFGLVLVQSVLGARPAGADAGPFWLIVIPYSVVLGGVLLGRAQFAGPPSGK